MSTAKPLSRSLMHISGGLSVLIICIAVVAMTATFLQRQEVNQFRQGVGRSIDTVSTLSLELADAQNQLMMFDATNDPDWSRRAQGSFDQIRLTMEGLGEVAVVTGKPRTTDSAVMHLERWLNASGEILTGARTASSVANNEYPAARSSLTSVANELQEIREERRGRLDLLIRGSSLAILAATAAALVGVLLTARHNIRRLTMPLYQLKKMVDARVAGNNSVRARTDQGFSEAVRLAEAINEQSDANDTLRAAQEATIRSHQLAERCAVELASNEGMGTWSSALEVLREGLVLDGVALLVHDDDGSLVIPTNGDLSWAEVPPEALDPPAENRAAEVVAMDLELGGQSVGTLLARKHSGRWSASDAESLDLCSNHLAASLAFQSVIRAARQLDADKTRFLATTSHELRTPVTAIVAWLSLLQEGDLGELSEDQQHAIGVVERNIARLRILIEDLLTVNQLDSGHARAVRTQMDVGAIVCRVIESLKPMADRAGVSLTSQETPCSVATIVQGDPGQMERAITNIAQNAVKFTRSGGSVDLRTLCKGSTVSVTCADTGIGIPSHELPHVLERFHRAENALGLPGTGLGLSIVDSILEAHGGSFHLDSTEGEGTTVTLTLPSSLEAASSPVG